MKRDYETAIVRLKEALRVAGNRSQQCIEAGDQFTYDDLQIVRNVYEDAIDACNITIKVYELLKKDKPVFHDEEIGEIVNNAKLWLELKKYVVWESDKNENTN